jgi:hypothetical protein
MTLLSLQPPDAFPDPQVVAARRRSMRGLHLVLLKPPKDDDDGYILRHWHGDLPSNTLATLYALSEDVQRRQALRDDLQMSIERLDEAVHKIQLACLGRMHASKPAVCFS